MIHLPNFEFNALEAAAFTRAAAYIILLWVIVRMKHRPLRKYKYVIAVCALSCVSALMSALDMLDKDSVTIINFTFSVLLTLHIVYELEPRKEEKK